MKRLILHILFAIVLTGNDVWPTHVLTLAIPKLP